MSVSYPVRLVKTDLASIACIAKVTPKGLQLNRVAGELLFKFPWQRITSTNLPSSGELEVQVVLDKGRSGKLRLQAAGPNPAEVSLSDLRLGILQAKEGAGGQIHRAESMEPYHAAESLKLQSVMLGGPADPVAFLTPATAASEEAAGNLTPRRSSILQNPPVPPLGEDGRPYRTPRGQSATLNTLGTWAEGGEARGKLTPRESSNLSPTPAPARSEEVIRKLTPRGSSSFSPTPAQGRGEEVRGTLTPRGTSIMTLPPVQEHGEAFTASFTSRATPDVSWTPAQQREEEVGGKLTPRGSSLFRPTRPVVAIEEVTMKQTPRRGSQLPMSREVMMDLVNKPTMEMGVQKATATIEVGRDMQQAHEMRVSTEEARGAAAAELELVQGQMGEIRDMLETARTIAQDSLAARQAMEADMMDLQARLQTAEEGLEAAHQQNLELEEAGRAAEAEQQQEVATLQAALEAAQAGIAGSASALQEAQVTISDLEEQMTDLQVKACEDETRETQRAQAFERGGAATQGGMALSLQQEVAALRAQLAAERDAAHANRQHDVTFMHQELNSELSAANDRVRLLEQLLSQAGQEITSREMTREIMSRDVTREITSRDVALQQTRQELAAAETRQLSLEGLLQRENANGTQALEDERERHRQDMDGVNQDFQHALAAERQSMYEQVQRQIQAMAATTQELQHTLESERAAHADKLTRVRDSHAAELDALRATFQQEASAMEDRMRDMESNAEAVTVAQGRIQSLEDELEVTRQELDAQRSETAATRTHVQHAGASLQDLQRQLQWEVDQREGVAEALAEAQGQIGSLGADLGSARDEIRNLSAEISSAHAQIHRAEASLKALQREKAALEWEVKQKERALQDLVGLQREKAALEWQLEEKERALQDLNGLQRDKAALEWQLEQKERGVQELTQQDEHLLGELERTREALREKAQLEWEVKQKERGLAELTQQNEHQLLELEGTREALREIERQNKQLLWQAQGREGDLAGYNERVGQLQRELQQSRGELREAHAAHAQLQAAHKEASDEASLARADLEAALNELEAANDEVENAKAREGAMLAQIEALRGARDELQSANDEVQNAKAREGVLLAQIKALKNAHIELEAAHDELANAKAREGALVAQIEGLRQQLAASVEDKETFQTRLAACEDELQGVKGEPSAADEVRPQAQGKAVRRNQPESDAKDALLDLLRVTAERDAAVKDLAALRMVHAELVGGLLTRGDGAHLQNPAGMGFASGSAEMEDSLSGRARGASLSRGSLEREETLSGRAAGASLSWDETCGGDQTLSQGHADYADVITVTRRSAISNFRAAQSALETMRIAIATATQEAVEGQSAKMRNETLQAALEGAQARLDDEVQLRAECERRVVELEGACALHAAALTAAQGEAEACKQQAQRDRDALASAHEQAARKLRLALDTAEQRLAEVEKELARVQAAIQFVTSQYDSKCAELAAHARELQAVRGELQRERTETRALKSDLAGRDREADGVRGELSSSRAAQREAALQGEEAKRAESAAKRELQHAKEAQKSAQATCTTLAAELRGERAVVQGLKRELAHLRQCEHEAESRRALLEGRVKEVEESLAASRRDAADLQRNLSEALARERTSKQWEAAQKLDLQAANDQTAALEKEIKDVRAAQLACETEASRLREELQTLRSQKKTTEDELARAKEGHDLLREQTKHARVSAQRAQSDAQQVLSRMEAAERVADEASARANSRISQLEGAVAASEAAFHGERHKAADLELQVDDLLLTLQEKEKELSTAAEALSHVSGRLHAADLEASAARAACTEACAAISSAASCPVTPRFFSSTTTSARPLRIPACVPGQSMISSLGRQTITAHGGDLPLGGIVEVEADGNAEAPGSQQMQLEPSTMGMGGKDRDSNAQHPWNPQMGKGGREYDGSNPRLAVAAPAGVQPQATFKQNLPLHQGMGLSCQESQSNDSVWMEDVAPRELDDHCSMSSSSADGADPASDGRASPLQLRRTYSAGGHSHGAENAGLATPQGYENFHVQENEEFTIHDTAQDTAVSLPKDRTACNAQLKDLADSTVVSPSRRRSPYEAIIQEGGTPESLGSRTKVPVASRRMTRPSLTPTPPTAVAAIAAYPGRRSTLLARTSVTGKDGQDHVAMKLDVHSVQARNSAMIRTKQAEALKSHQLQAEKSKKRIRTSSFALPVRNDAASWSS